MQIRTIQEEDIENCAKLYVQTFTSSPWNESWSYSTALERLSHFYQSKGFIGILAEDQDVVSFALGNTEPFYSGLFFYLREMCTKQDLQNNGIGKKVFQALETTLQLLDTKSIYLTTERGIPAAGFYLSCGFTHNNNMGFYSKNIL